jgi:hypothetical protein
MSDVGLIAGKKGKKEIGHCVSDNNIYMPGFLMSCWRITWCLQRILQFEWNRQQQHRKGKPVDFPATNKKKQKKKKHNNKLSTRVSKQCSQIILVIFISKKKKLCTKIKGFLTNRVAVLMTVMEARLTVTTVVGLL